MPTRKKSCVASWIDQGLPLSGLERWHFDRAFPGKIIRGIQEQDPARTGQHLRAAVGILASFRVELSDRLRRPATCRHPRQTTVIGGSENDVVVVAPTSLARTGSIA